MSRRLAAAVALLAARAGGRLLQADDGSFSCPLLEAATCRTEVAARFLERWRDKLRCWLCPDVTEDLAKQAVGLIKEVAQLDVGMTRGWGMQITRAWLDKCLGAYLLAMLVSTRGQPMQPWAMYQFGLNIIWTCQYNEVEFFNAFGVTTGQMAYVFGLVGQPYDATPQILGLQEPERAAVGAHAPAVDEVPARAWDSPLVLDVGMGLGADARYYLRQGFRVVAVEANPLALDAALSDPGTHPYLVSGQLTVLNAAVASPGAEGAKTSFWVIPQRPEQSKASSWIAADGGVEVTVRTVRCADLLRVYGQALYMKVDVEVNTVDCLASLSQEMAALGGRARAAASGWSPPHHLSLEVEASHLVPIFHEHLLALGYVEYKVCRQFVFSPGPCEQGSYGSELLGCGSGPFGEAAVDYKSGTRWRSLSELPGDVDFVREFESGFDWFDIHARLR